MSVTAKQTMLLENEIEYRKIILFGIQITFLMSVHATICYLYNWLEHVHYESHYLQNSPDWRNLTCNNLGYTYPWFPLYLNIKENEHLRQRWCFAWRYKQISEKALSLKILLLDTLNWCCFDVEIIVTPHDLNMASPSQTVALATMDMSEHQIISL